MDKRQKCHFSQVYIKERKLKIEILNEWITNIKQKIYIYILGCQTSISMTQEVSIPWVKIAKYKYIQ